MQTHELIAHPDHPPQAVRAITARIDASDAHWLRLRWRIEGAKNIVVPPLAGRGRTDGLWQTTCCEFFVISPELPAGAYREFNFSPSQAWAAYDFPAYREQSADSPMPRPPVIAWRGSRDLAIVDVAVPGAALPAKPWQCGISAVIEEQGGYKSFWALAHPEGKPDFHDPACFAATFPGREAP